MSMTSEIVSSIKENNQDFEWYPTTSEMIDAVKLNLDKSFSSIMDIGAGDGRVLIELGKCAENPPSLYAIEKSSILIQTWPENIIPVGTEFFEQNLICLQVDYIFCNPPYSEYESWASNIIEYGYAKRAFLVIPRRWKDSDIITSVLKKRGAVAKIIHSDDFFDAERRARAVVDIVEISYPTPEWRDYDNKPLDPFDTWFNQNVSTFDQEKEVESDEISEDIAKQHQTDNIIGLVNAFDEEYNRMQENYRAIFKLDYAILKELGVEKNAVCQGLKKRISGLKNKYWTILFERLSSITSRLCADTKKRFLEKLTGRASIAFTASNAYSVVIWAIKNANKYFDEQLIKLYKDLSTPENIKNYKSNQRTWQKDGWRYQREGHNHYMLDYRIVIQGYRAIQGDNDHSWDFPNGLHNNCHNLIGDTLAVLNNLGYPHSSPETRQREWIANSWQNFTNSKGEILVQAKAFKNGNVHFRFMPDAIKALNVEAGRLLGWLKNPQDVVSELGYSIEEAEKFFHSSQKILPSSMKCFGFSEAS